MLCIEQNSNIEVRTWTCLFYSAYFSASEIWLKNEGGVLTKAIREVEVMCLAGNIPESIDVDVENIELGQSIRLTEITLPEGAEIPGLSDETDQMVISVNAPKAVEEEPEVLDDEEMADGESDTESESNDEPEADSEGSEES